MIIKITIFAKKKSDNKRQYLLFIFDFAKRYQRKINKKLLNSTTILLIILLLFQNKSAHIYAKN